MDIDKAQLSLLKWFLISKRDLPWRQTSNPYFIWVSEVMLQQTQVSTVIDYYLRFIEKYPTVESLAKADLQDVLKIWEGLGYYARCRNLHKAAQIVTKEFDGKIPDDYECFRSLAGVGEYIGAAVQSIAFKKPYAAVDGNVKRVLARFFLLENPINDSKSKKVFQEYADKFLYEKSPGDFNEAMMELGATICRPQKPVCHECPISEYCQAAQTNQQDDLPVRLPRKKIPQYAIVVGIVQKNEQILITKRKADGLLGGLWEFPGGNIQNGENAQNTCLREIKKEVGLEIEVGREVTSIKHAYSHFRIIMDVFLCNYLCGDVLLDAPVDYRWITIDEIDRFPVTGATNKLIPSLKRILGEYR